MPSARRIGRRSTLSSANAERRPLIELEAPESQSQSSVMGPVALRNEVATPADSVGRTSDVEGVALAAEADADGEEVVWLLVRDLFFFSR